MPLPRPGRVARIPEAAPTGRESLPEIEQAEDVAPPLGGMKEAEEAPTLGRAFQRPAAVATQAAAPWEDEEAEAEIVQEPEREIQLPTPPTTVQRPVTAVQQAPQSAVTQVATGSASANVNQTLANLGFEGLDLGTGFGAFPTVVLKDDVFSTSDGDKLGETFGCVIHSSRPKWIVKSSDGKEAEYKYTNDKVNDTSGRPLENVYKIWRAQGLMTGDPVFKAYLDVTAQLVDVSKKEMGQVVILQIPATSIERLKGYLVNLALQQNNPADTITQVYLGAKVTSTKHAFWPWAFRRWGSLSQLGL